MSTTGACGCCAGVEARTPLAVENRPGLSAVAYRVGTHPDFLASMLAGLTDADRPRLAELTSREPDDFTVALLDAWAVVADVLTFYIERLAQESYLRTARERISLQELGRLIGYRLRPGVAAQTQLAFALEPPPTPPPAASRDPGARPPVTPASVVLESRLRVQSIPGPGEQPQTFETVEEITARPEWNAIPARRTTAAPGLGSSKAWLQGADLGLRVGDALLLSGGAAASDPWAVRVIGSVDTHPPENRTLVRWAGAVTAFPAGSPPTPYVLRKRLRVFGHNAPLWRTMSTDFKNAYRGTAADTGQWPDYVISSESGKVDVDGSQPDVADGSWVVLLRPGATGRFKVSGVSELSRAAFAISGTVTRLGLTVGTNHSDFSAQVQATTVLGVSEPLALAEAPDETGVAGDTIDVTVDVSAMAPGRRLLVSGRTTTAVEHSEAAVVESVSMVAGGWRLVLEEPLSVSYDRASVVVHGNVALATHGETVHQILGAGDASAAFQCFALAHAPLTHLQSTGATGTASTLEVRVNDVPWREVPTLYGAGGDDRSYAVRPDEQGATVVAFGDGVHGARLPTGGQNVRARYRKGIGAGGNVGARALAQLLDRPLGVKGVTNPVTAEGGVDPEPEEAARATIPLAVRTLGRAVSLLDYEDFARAFAGVAKALATVLPLRAGRTIVVTVALTGPPGPGTADRLNDLAVALRTYGDPQVLVQVVPHHLDTFRLALRVAVEADREADAVLAAVEAALRQAYSFDRRGFGEPVHRSDVVAVVHSVPGVVAVDVDRLYSRTAFGLADRLLAQRPAVDAAGAAVPAGLLLLADGPLDWLEVMP
jgi:predicted phage baseplate assembly protein